MKSSAILKIHSHNDVEQHIVRDPVFSRFETIFGMEHHTCNRIHLGAGHVFTIYYTYLWLTGQVPITTVYFELFYGYLGGLGITVGCHRYWAHKTFKANLPLQVILMVLQTIASQWPIHKWCLDHRIHHKYTDTDSDPHNSKRGFWFSHMLWLVLPKHRDFKEKLKTFPMNDLENDPVVRFQCKYYYTLFHVFFFIIPISVFYLIWEMPLLFCIAANYRRFIISHHITATVNSVAHMWGSKPYDKCISSVNNPIVSFFAVGEGWHNYHHTFPWDYKASEFPWKFNVSTMVIDFFASIGWAWDLKTVSPEILVKRVKRTGDISNISGTSKKETLFKEIDGSHKGFHDINISSNKTLWGWDDNQMPEEFRKATNILSPKKIP